MSLQLLSLNVAVFGVRCPIILITGQQSLFSGATKALHLAILKTCRDRTRVEFLEIAGVANVLEEKASISVSKMPFSLLCDCSASGDYQ